MPSFGTRRREIRIGDAVWARLGEQAEAMGTDRSAVIRALILWWLGYPGAELPERPEEG